MLSYVLFLWCSPGVLWNLTPLYDATTLGWASGGAVNNSRRIVAREQMKWHDLWCYIIHYYLLFYIKHIMYVRMYIVYTPHVCAFNIKVIYKLYMYNIWLNRWPRNVPWYTYREAGGQNEVKFIIIIITLLLLYYVEASTRQRIKGCGQENWNGLNRKTK